MSLRKVGRVAACASAVLALNAIAVPSFASTPDATGVFNLLDRGDSGTTGPDWAKDDMTRTITLTPGNQLDPSHWAYVATVTDSGHFTTITGAVSPQAGKPIKGVVHGVIQGGETLTFTTTSKTPTSPKPETLSGDGDSTSTAHMLAAFFPANTTLSQYNTDAGWWTYTATKDCVTEKWTDGAPSWGQGAANGDITGVFAGGDKCPAPKPKSPPSVPAPPAPSSGSSSGTSGSSTSNSPAAGTGSGTAAATGLTGQVSQVPVGAPNTGGGATAQSNRWLVVLGALISGALGTTVLARRYVTGKR